MSKKRRVGKAFVRSDAIPLHKDKHSRETSLGVEFSKALNATLGSDYHSSHAEDENDIADVHLVSPSKKFPFRKVQIVSAPIVTEREDLIYRDDNGNLQGLKSKLEQRLFEAGGKGLEVHIIPTDLAITNRVPSAIIDDLGTRILACSHKSEPVGEGEEVHGDLADWFTYVNCIRMPDSEPPVVMFNRSAWLPADGDWIAEAIRKKLNDYGGEANVRDVSLLIDAQAFITDLQIKAFLKAEQSSKLPFLEIWLYSPFGGMRCL